jgi:hypothetical protein
MTASRKREGATALDYVKTKQRVEAKSAEKAAGAKAAKASGDSPKRQGDKLERARDAAAGRAKSR